MAIIAFTGAVFASPVQIEKRSAFTVEQVLRSIRLKNGPAQIVKTLNKYGKEIPAHLVKAAEYMANNTVVTAALESGTVAANPLGRYDELYLSPVVVGGKILHLDIDTGSADLWVYSSLQSSHQVGAHGFYITNPAKLMYGYDWEVSYADGSSAYGVVYIDTVSIGGVTATSQAVEAASTVSKSIREMEDIDGVLGLGFGSLNTVLPKRQRTFFDSVKSHLAMPLFAAQLRYHGQGSYDFGFIDSSKYTGPITYVPVDNSRGHWGFISTGYSIGTGDNINWKIDAILDTATTLVFLDTNIVEKYYSQIKGGRFSRSSGGFVFSCEETPPDFAIIVGGVKQNIPGAYINYAPLGNGKCFGGLQSNAGIGFSILGDVFLKSKYIIFDQTTNDPRAGFAQQVGIPH
ncbi:Asp multi-domain protein [Pyrenophora tritici-repentis]|uniref:Asp multi-domain protein n=2 Tax=Pyrenophora tritici-repentis TaxID=45151 RepID=A0A2W1FA10_9PLEO|nr:aspergillopepsin A precursor [Pyrenophora tritici-repentis Pt-1C-BFP]KAA8621140.1 Asp multi-domain protein [Pyrenophora tritici-repentis]EDU43540.1 aspergillopepsin A precursor [Pyrenophora tritici-repentis Pt-1C-BFP]KAF7450384.1 Asp multi-domain protein [Pyrenophora tritici-repentis]KAF7572989.1 Asp multi-domain protein [Pyrenophora tritici-repentis]KAI0574831.1 Asp multi-domain protein [Pyrenophora tritici-repentis]